MPAPEPTTPATVRFRAPAEIPLPQLEGSGVAISVTPAARADGTRTLRVVGVCACGAEELPLDRLPLEAVWIVATLAIRPPAPVSFSVAGDALVFADDHQHVGGRLRAVFDLDLFAQAGLLPAPGLYRVCATLGPYVTPVIEARI